MLEQMDTGLQVLQPEKISQAPHLVRAEMFHMKQLSNLPEHMMTIYLTMGPAYALMENDAPIAAAGVILGQPGLGSAWAMIPPAIRKRPFTLHRATLRALSMIIADHNLRRVDYIIDPQDEIAAKWAARLGFEYEGTLRAFFFDHDAWLCAWVK